MASMQAGERLKTAEELETAELARLQNLERQRQLRMSGDDLGGPESLEDKLPAGGYARKRAKRQREEEEAANESGPAFRLLLAGSISRTIILGFPCPLRSDFLVHGAKMNVS